MRARRNEQRVHEIGIAIERGVAGAEVDLDGVVFRGDFLFRNDDVVLDQPIVRRPARDGDRFQVIRARA